jgi:hypothetical protein
MRIWCIKIGIVLALHENGMTSLPRRYPKTDTFVHLKCFSWEAGQLSINQLITHQTQWHKMKNANEEKSCNITTCIYVNFFDLTLHHII